MGGGGGGGGGGGRVRNGIIQTYLGVYKTVLFVV